MSNDVQQQEQPPRNGIQNKRTRNYTREVRELDGISKFISNFRENFKWLNSAETAGVQINHLLYDNEIILATSDHVAILHSTCDDNVPYSRTPGRLFLTKYRLMFWPAPCTCQITSSFAHESWCTTFGPASGNGIPFLQWPLDYSSPGSLFQSDREPVIVQVPLLCTARLEVVAGQVLALWCKDVRRVLLHFSSTKDCDGFRVLLEGFAFHEHLENTFAFQSAPRSQEAALFSMRDEYRRLGMLPTQEGHVPGACPRLRLLTQSAAFEWCTTYPHELVVPSAVSEEALRKCARYRSRNRLPVATWMHPGTKAILARCAQPLSGFRNVRCEEDEAVVAALLSSSRHLEPSGAPSGAPARTALSGPAGEASITQNLTGVVSGVLSSINPWAGGRSSSDSDLRGLGEAREVGLKGRSASADTLDTLDATEEEDGQYYIIDARSQMAAMGNRALGKGTENPANYPGATMVFMNIENIHAVRGCFQKVVESCLKRRDEDRDLGAFLGAQAGWLLQVRSVLKASMEMAAMLHEEGRSVLTHCSDGWDRTSQMVSLGQLLLDPHYRTARGFGVLIEKEWLSFGHKFLERCDMLGWPRSNEQEVSPIFVLWVDAVWQVLSQFPDEFEFTSDYLIAILDHLYSGRYLTFLHNNQMQRVEASSGREAMRLWQDLEHEQFYNKSFNAPQAAECRVLRPSVHFKVLKFWSEYFLRWDPITTPPNQVKQFF